MLELARGLTRAQLDAIADLERRVLAVDGGRLKLEWGVLRSRPAREIRDLLWWREDRLVGFLGIYWFGWPTAELAGMVDPALRRQGIGSGLLDAALPICDLREPSEILLVVPRNSEGGGELARGRGGELEHSEHALQLISDPPGGPADPAVSLRPAIASDIPELARLYQDGFGSPLVDSPAQLTTDRARTWVVARDEESIGTVRVSLDDELGGVYGFVIASAWRGRGIGRDVLRRVCRQLREQGAKRIGLEVAVDNDGALGLYTSLGFERIATEDYYRLPQRPGGDRS